MNNSTSSVHALRLLICLALVWCYSASAQAQLWKQLSDALLSEEQAFAVDVWMQDSTLHINWTIAEDYYMYKDNFGIKINTPDIFAQPLVLPEGVIEDDPEFGRVEVFFLNANLKTELSQTVEAGSHLEVVLLGQGCNKPIGVCYPPMQRTVQINLDNELAAYSPQPMTSASWWNYLLSAFVAGLLLSFTPCVLPLIPILAAWLAGQNKLSQWHMGGLSLCYVSGTMLTYALAGFVAGATGAQFQAWFQTFWFIAVITVILLLMAMALFGVFHIHLPSSIQSQIDKLILRLGSGAVSGIALGALSALVIGTCVSPILIVVVGAAISQGDPLLGAAMMASMALGMGILLIVFGFGAAWLLPKTGAWMQRIQQLLAFAVIAVAIYIGQVLVSFSPLYLWACWLLALGWYIWRQISTTGSPLRPLSRCLAGLILLWGVISLAGAVTGSSNLTRPWDTFFQSSQYSADFKTVTSLPDALKVLEQSRLQGEPVVLEFYARWCLDCRRMKRTTYVDQGIVSQLAGWTLLEIDVTENNEDALKAKQYFQVFGPPATLFFAADGKEKRNLRQYGYIDTTEMSALITETTRQ